MLKKTYQKRKNPDITLPKKKNKQHGTSTRLPTNKTKVEERSKKNNTHKILVINLP